jgi:hypothetical protein
MSDVLERIFAFGLAGASIVISLLDFAGLLQGIPFLAGHTSALSLLVLGSAVGYLALERRSKLDKIEEEIRQGFERTHTSISGGRVKLFEDMKDMEEYIARRTKEARRSVDDLTWGDHLTKRRTPGQDTAFKQYLSAKSYITKGTSVDYREVMTFPRPDRLARAESLAGREHFGYQLRYYDIDHTLLPPLIQFTIFDSEEVIFTFHRGRYVPAEPEIHLATRQKEIVQLFQDYFNAIWERAKVIKATGEPADPQVLQHIKQQYHPTPTQ